MNERFYGPCAWRWYCRSLAGALLLACLPSLAAAQGLSPPVVPSYLPDAVPEQNEEGALFSVPLSEPDRPEEWFLTIYSGTTMGTYFYVASAICSTLHASFDEHKTHCVPLRSAGAGGNVRLMNEGRAQAIMVQSDTNYYAAKGRETISGGRSAMSLHDEIGVLVVGADSDIESIDDLPGKDVNLGPEGTATRHLWMQLLETQGIAMTDLGRRYAATQDSNVLALCEGSIDAFASWIGHPSDLVDQAVERCDARVVGMWSPKVEQLVQDREYLYELELPAGTYARQREDIRSYGFKASLVVREEVPNHIVYNLVKSLVENVEEFKGRHPALRKAHAYDFFDKGNFLPFHPGAARFYRERGWLRDRNPRDAGASSGSAPQTSGE